MQNAKRKVQNRLRRHRRARAKFFGTLKRPRLSVFRSSRHVHLQLIDDGAGKTLAFASSREADSIKGKINQAQAVGKLLAQRALALGIKAVVFDRGGYKYHGRVKAVAETVRGAGLKI